MQIRMVIAVSVIGGEWGLQTRDHNFKTLPPALRPSLDFRQSDMLEGLDREGPSR